MKEAERTPMKLSMSCSDLQNALSHVHNVVEKRTTIPILSNVLLRAYGNTLELTATDLDLEAVDIATASIVNEGAITAPAQTLAEVVKKLPGLVDIHLETDPESNQLIVTSGKARFELPTLPSDDFQSMGDQPMTASFTLPAKALRRLFDKTKFSISNEETRYYLNGIYLHIFSGSDGPLLRAVATDGHRLALAEMPAPDGLTSLEGVIIPKKAIVESLRLLDGVDEDVTVSVSNNIYILKAGRAVLTSKLIDGSFPDYKRVIPLHNPSLMVVDNKAFLQAVDRVATISTERSRSIKLNLADGNLVLAVNQIDSGKSREELEVDFTAAPVEVGFNARYVTEISSNIVGEQVHYAFADPTSPVLVTDPADDAVKFVIMPLRV